MQFCGNFYTTTRVKPDSDTSGVGSEAISGIPFPQYPDQLDKKAFMKGVYESAVRQKRKQCPGTSTRVTSGVGSEAIFGPCKLFPQYCKHFDEKDVMKDLYEIPAVQGSGTIKYGKDDPLGPLLIEFANLAIDYYNLQYNTCYQFLEIKYASRSVWVCGDTFLFTFEAQTPDKKKLDHFKATMFHRFNKERKLEEVVLLEPNSRPWIRIPMFTL